MCLPAPAPALHPGCAQLADFACPLVRALAVPPAEVGPALTTLTTLTILRLLSVLQHFNYKAMSLTDTPSQNIMQHFGETSAFIREARNRGGSVFLHCVEGKSRSATCVIAYLIDTEGMSLSEALGRVRGSRPIVRPNEGFLIQLAHYEKIARSGHAGNGGGGSLQQPNTNAGFRLSATSPQPMQPPYPPVAQDHPHAHRFHPGHAAYSHQHAAQWTGNDRGMPSKASAPPQMPPAQQPMHYGKYAYDHVAAPAPMQTPDPQYADPRQHQRMAEAYRNGGVHSHPYMHDQRAPLDEQPWSPRSRRHVGTNGYEGAGWSRAGMDVPARGEAVSPYSSYSGQRAPPRAMGHRTASASVSEAEYSQQLQYPHHLDVNDMTDRASLHAAGFPTAVCPAKRALQETAVPSSISRRAVLVCCTLVQKCA